MPFLRPAPVRRIAWIALATWLVLMLPIFAAGPTVSGTLPTRTVLSGTGEQLNLSSVFQATDATGTVVQLTVVMSGTDLVTGTNTIDLALSDTATPVTVANFLSYVQAGNFNNTFFHRSYDQFAHSMEIVQGGGFLITDGTSNLTASTLGSVVNRGEIVNEYSSSYPNAPGTIAMARLSSGINTASSQWFINVADNSSALGDVSGSNQYAVFGNVIGSGTSVASQIFGLPTSDIAGRIDNNLDSAFTQMPLSQVFSGTTSGLTVPRSDVVVVQSAQVIPSLTFSATSSNPAVVATGTSSTGVLSLNYLSSGTATITVTATDVEGNSTSDSFAVAVQPPASTLVAFQSGSLMVSGTCGTATLNVVCTGGTSGAFTVPYTTAGGTAVSSGTGGTNYTATSGTLNFDGTGAPQVISIPITSSTVPAPGKTFMVQLSQPSGEALLGTGSTATVTISDNVSGVLQLSATTYSALQGTGTLEVDVTRTSGTTGSVSALITTQDGTAVSGTDYSGAPQCVTFAAGDTATKSVFIPLGNVTGSGQAKTFTVLLQPLNGAVVGTSTTATAFINDVWQVEIPSPTYEVSGSLALITVQRTGTAAGVSVNYMTVDGTTGTTGTAALSGVDYTGTNGTLLFTAGITTGTIQVPLLSSTAASAALERSFTVCLTGTPTGETVISPSNQQTTVTIVPSTISTSTNAVSYTFDQPSYRFDGNPNSDCYVTIDRNTVASGTVKAAPATSGTAAVFVQLIDGSATFGVDYAASTGTAAGDRIVEVDFANGDSSETFYLTGMGSGLNKTLTAQLVNVSSTNGAIGAQNTTQITFFSTEAADQLIEFVEPSYSVNPSSGKAILTVMRGPLTTGTATVTYATEAGSAKAGRDYVATSGTLTFLPGVAAQDIEVPLKSTTVTGRTFEVNLNTPGGTGAIGAQNSTTVAIVPGKAAYSFHFQKGSYLFNTSNTQISEVVIERSSAQTSGTVYVELINGTAKLGPDYLPYYQDPITGEWNYQQSDNGSPSQVVSVAFASGATTAPLYLAGTGGGTKQLKLRLVSTSDSKNLSSIGTPSVTTVTFLDSTTPAGLVEFAKQSYLVDQSDGYAWISVYRTETSGSVSFQCAPVNGTAKAGVDFSIPSGATYGFPAGASYAYVPVKLLRNSAATSSKRSFTLKLTAVDSKISGAFLSAVNQSATVTIVAQNNPNGIFEFESPTYSFSEDSGWAELEVVRSSGTNGAADVYLGTNDNFSDATRDFLYSWPSSQSSSNSSDPIYQAFLPVHFEPGQVRQEVYIPLMSGGATYGGYYSSHYGLKSSSSTQTIFPFTAFLYSSTAGVVGGQSAAVVSDYADEYLTTPSVQFDSTQYRINDNAGSITLHAVLFGSNTVGISVPFQITSNSAELLAALGTDYSPIGGGNVLLTGTAPTFDGTNTVATVVSGTLYFPYGVNEVDLPIQINQGPLPANGAAPVMEKRFSVQMQAPSSGNLLAQTEATVTIIDQDASKGVFQVENPTYNFYDNCGSFTVNVVRTGTGSQLSGTATVDVTTGDGSASGAQYTYTSGIDGYQITSYLNYISNTQTLNFAANETKKSFTVQTGPTAVSGSENMLVRIESADAGAQIGAQDTAVVTLLNPDDTTTPALSFDQSSYAVNETGSSAEFDITVNLANVSGTWTVPYSISDGSATAGNGDYLPLSSGSAVISGSTGTSGSAVFTGTLTFAPNVSTVEIPVQISSTSQADRTFSVQLNAAGAALNGTASSVAMVGANPVPVTIHPAGLFQFDASSYTVDQAASKVVLRIVRSGTGQASVQLQTADYTAYAGTDYDAVNTTVFFAPGVVEQAVPVELLGNSGAQRYFTASLYPTVPGTVGALNTVNVYLEPVASGSTPVAEFNQGAYDVYDTGTLFAGMTLYASGSSEVGIPYSIIPQSNFAKSGLTGAQAGVNMGPKYTFTAGTGIPASGTGTAIVTGTLTFPSSSGGIPNQSGTSISATLASGTALTSGTVTLPIMKSNLSTATLEIPMIANSSAGPLSQDRYFLLQVGNPVGGTAIGNTLAPVTIHSTNNPYGVIEFAARNVSLTPGDAGEIILNRLGGTKKGMQKVVNVFLVVDPYATTAVEGEDYAGSQWEIPFTAGQSQTKVWFTPKKGATLGRTITLVLAGAKNSPCTVTTWAEHARITLTIGQ